MKLAETPSRSAGLIISVFGVASSPMASLLAGKNAGGREAMGEEATPKTEMINPALLDGVSANFIVKGPSGVEKSYPMRQLAVTIGRSDQCDISVKDSSMSGRHAEISKINGEIKVRDMG